MQTGPSPVYFGPGSGLSLLEARSSKLATPSSVPERDPPPRQVVRGKLDRDAVAWEDADVVLPHLAGEMAENGVAVLRLDAEHGVRQGLGDAAVHRQRVGV